MRRIPKLLGTIFLGAALLAPVITTGCEGRVTVYDTWHGDRHHWDDREEVVYRGYLTENHHEYRPYKKLSRDEQKSYWDWRHKH
jgi:hypothetical protein